MRLIQLTMLVAVLAPTLGAGRRLPPVDLKQQVIWSSRCTLPDGAILLFGGQDQQADDGRLLTRFIAHGVEQDRTPLLRVANPHQRRCDQLKTLRNQLKDQIARIRRSWFDALPLPPEVEPRLRQIAASAADAAPPALAAGIALLPRDVPAALHQLLAAQVALEQSAEALDAQPAARALSPLVLDAPNRRVYLFGGDHLDYLTNDLWAYDIPTARWRRLDVPEAPRPRAGHTLTVGPDGRLRLSGGYTYTSSTDYCGAQYADLDDGPFTFNPATGRWSGSKLVAANARTYRTGPFSPDYYYLDTPRPDPAATADRLGRLPPNTWMRMHPPRLPQLNRDWGTAVLDPGRNLILRYSGGHSAHGGTDVLHYHLATNRWELPFAVEFPLGQLYSNTSYPDGRNFNGRPWITGHTYQSYAVDPLSHLMVFTGRRNFAYIYDPDIADWTRRYPKPREMSYGSAYYTLTLTPTPRGLICWTNQGQLLLLDSQAWQWRPLPLTGVKLPGSCVDNSTLTYDTSRNRLLFFRKQYAAKPPYDGQVYAVDLKTLQASVLNPANAPAAGAIPYLCQIRYSPDTDTCLVGARMPDGTTPLFDCAANAWTFIRLSGDDPNGKTGRNVSLGLMYDRASRLFWAVDTHSEVYVLRLQR